MIVSGRRTIGSMEMFFAMLGCKVDILSAIFGNFLCLGDSILALLRPSIEERRASIPVLDSGREFKRFIDIVDIGTIKQ